MRGCGKTVLVRAVDHEILREEFSIMLSRSITEIAI